MQSVISKFGRGTIVFNGIHIHYFRVRVLDNETNLNICNKYDLNPIKVTALKKYKHTENKIVQNYLEINLLSTDYSFFTQEALNIYRVLREVAMDKLDKKYSFILEMSNPHIYH